MSIRRVGSTEKYAANWATAFGEKKKARIQKKKSTAGKKKIAKKKTKR